MNCIRSPKRQNREPTNAKSRTIACTMCGRSPALKLVAVSEWIGTISVFWVGIILRSAHPQARFSNNIPFAGARITNNAQIAVPRHNTDTNDVNKKYCWCPGAAD